MFSSFSEKDFVFRVAESVYTEISSIKIIPNAKFSMGGKNFDPASQPFGGNANVFIPIKVITASIIWDYHRLIIVLRFRERIKCQSQ